MNLSDRPIANPVVVLREEFDDWAVLYNPDIPYAAGTNPVGVAVWKLMDGRKSVTEIVLKIKNSFENVPEGAEKEIFFFVDQLRENGFAGLELEVR